MPYRDQRGPGALRKQARDTARIAERRALWFLENGPCRLCGSWDNLQVDHIDPTWKVSHRIWSWRADRRSAELAKCQVLCVKCHKAKTTAEGWNKAAVAASAIARRAMLHCKRGHVFTPENTRIYRQKRFCRACCAARALQRYYRLREQRKDAAIPCKNRVLGAVPSASTNVAQAARQRAAGL